MTDDIYEIPSRTPDLQTELAQKLQDLVPEAVADGKIDVVKLTELLADDAADSNERFGLFWPGKKRALRAAQEPTTATLRPDKVNSKDWDTTKNVFIEGDNLEVLKILQKHYHGKIKMIYIDPPYNTGKDFVYPDNYKDGLQTYFKWTKQVNEEGKKVSTNSESEGRYHSNWLNLLYPRLKLARNLLTQDGVIFISIDQHEHANLLRVCAEVFGESNVLGSVAVVNNLKGRSDDEYFATAHEYLVACGRNNEGATIYGFATSAEYQAEFKLKDEISNYKEVGLQKTGKNARRIDRPNMYYPIYYSPETSSFSLEKAEGTVEIYPTPINGVDGRWRWGRETFLKNRDTELTARNVRGTWRVYVKMRDIVEGEARTVRPKSVWIDPKYDTAGGSRAVKELFDGNNYFDNPKPVAFIKDVLTIGAGKDSLILDFFAGSGTTAQAVMEQNADDGGNRKFIAVQLPEPTPEGSAARDAGYDTISELAIERIRRAGAKVGKVLAGSEVDSGFRVFKLADTNFTKWRVQSDVEPDKLEQFLLGLRDSAEDNAAPEALLTELLLKQGYSLTEESTEVDVAGLALSSVGGGLLFAYLNEHKKPELDQLREVIDQEPARFVILEDAFHGDDELKTNLAQLCKSKGVELWTA
ncbi:site-specific DNA-methyltransferase [Dietzia cinnamea]|uniref:site-specific DNA-methyltransferase n=1 Tax=Dietzia cinnamea TaxID=321318 RepID=UPI0021A40842|nr:site-specific DNA-methyltransferase [Dietzia cinnamea]MCT1640596.1 site-specific DNA-methyltransferase [Dietzia cinnamea]